MGCAVKAPSIRQRLADGLARGLRGLPRNREMIERTLPQDLPRGDSHSPTRFQFKQKSNA
jgi:hypothetical protein